MGPPILLGGNTFMILHTAASPKRFNGATDFTRWKFFISVVCPSGFEQLQWGHRFYSVEMR